MLDLFQRKAPPQTARSARHVIVDRLAPASDQLPQDLTRSPATRAKALSTAGGRQTDGRRFPTEAVEMARSTEM